MNQYEKLLHAVNTTQPEPIRSELNIVTTNPKKQQSSAKPKTKPYVYVSGVSTFEPFSNLLVFPNRILMVNKKTIVSHRFLTQKVFNQLHWDLIMFLRHPLNIINIVSKNVDMKIILRNEEKKNYVIHPIELMITIVVLEQII